MPPPIDENVDVRLARVEGRIESHEARLDSLDRTAVELRKTIEDSKVWLTQRIDSSENRMSDKMDKINDNINTRLDSMKDEVSDTLKTTARSVPPNIAFIVMAILTLAGFVVGHVAK